jgi:ATP-dependent helicase/nuclease subunit B
VTSSPIIEVPAFHNILQYTADFIFNRFGNLSPDYSDLIVLLPHSQVAQPFNETLSRSLTSDLSAIIPPWAGTLKTWTKSFVSSQHPDYPTINEHSRQLLFIEALQQYPSLFKEENQWQVTQALLSLFDELSLNQKNIFTSPQEWQLQLQQAYGIDKQHQHLLNESNLVYTLWHAWQQQLSDNQLYDETGDYISRLTNAAAVIKKQHHFICLGVSQYSQTEQDFIQSLINNSQCHVIEYGQTITVYPYDKDQSAYPAHAFFSFIKETFSQPLTEVTTPVPVNPAAEHKSIKQRATRYAEQHSEHHANKLPFSTYLAADEEEQIRAIDYYVRLNILSGKNNIAIISEDRKLSRRLRALLERSNIPLQDKAGWSLATTQAATIIERWLECIEEDFSAYPLLDCLKSPFIDIISVTLGEAATDDDFRKNIYRFEHDLVFHENVSSNIEQYKSILKDRLKRLGHWPAKAYDDLINTLDHIQKTANTLSNFYSDFHSDNKKIPVSDFIQTLYTSLKQLGIIQRYHNDEAGLVLLKTFEALKQSTQYSDPQLSWYDCRIWLGMALDSQHFTPPTLNASVQLMTLEQASHLNFDCIIIAATEAQHFPGSAKNQPFFNQAVRASLGLITWETQRKQRHELFNRVLLAAPEILLTACDEEKGEEKPVSPWLELLINFYQLAFNKKSDNQQLRQLVQLKNEVINCDDTALPGLSTQPAPSIPPELLPERISASSYQRIINCPYQYFSADALGLKPLEELSDELKKSDYGERIHLILQTFHNSHNKYGKAFAHTITNANRVDAENHLNKLSEKIFLADLENNVLHRSWLYRWQKHIPSYISWQIQHQSDWNIYLSEKKLEIPLHATAEDSLKIYGRLDRIDHSREHQTHAIIDYKTGQTPRQEDVDIGEDVQLATYALLDHEASEVSYLSVDSSSQKVESKSSLSAENLQINREANRQRLSELFTQIKNKEPLPAWGDDTVCRFCNFSGLCRKAEWSI